ncbi:FAD-dependent oxidoreductase [Micromonospora aurantiaca]|uniref:FAD-dependent oxidoreductase n=1 Tax=Micromonospora aurantiaca (nom. illeg.) TaxID=47850 RepID=UPI00340C223A
MAARPDVVVLGAGVSGLSTGIRLVESGARVLVRTAAPPAHTTSALAGAMVGPNLSPPGDTGLHPVRGPRIVVRNPGLDRFFMEAPMAPTWASIFPHGDHVVLGGGQRRSDDTTPDPAEEADVLARCVAIEPALAAAEVLDHRVGLRPGRAAPRVEAERRGDALVVHNYGHAGNGVMLSWGCARDAAALALGPAPAA